MIFRAHFTQGELRVPITDHRRAKQILDQHISRVKLLTTGYYSLTPTWWRSNAYTYHLFVLSDGRAIYVTIPVSTVIPPNTRAEQMPFLPGAIPTLLPAHKQLIMVGKPVAEDSVELYEAVVYFDNTTETDKALINRLMAELYRS